MGSKRGSFPVAVAVACALAVALGACSAPVGTTVEEARAARAREVQPAVTAPVVSTDGVLRVAVLTGAGAPSVMEDSSGGLHGIDVDVACALAQQMGLTVELVPVASVADARSQGVDVVLGVDADDADGLSVVSSYMEDAVGFFERGDTARTASADDLTGGTVAVVAGSATAQAVAASPRLLATERPYDSLDEAFQALVAGEVDFVACPAYEGGYLATEYGGIVLAGTLDVPRTVGAGVDASNTALVAAVQEALDTVAGNGVLGVIRGRWVGPMEPLGAANQVRGLAEEGAPAARGDVQDASDTEGTGQVSATVPANGAGDGSTAGSNAVTQVG